MQVSLPEKVRMLLGLLQSNGFDAHIVGGCVRDSLMGIIPHDYDICTSATPGQMKQCFDGLRVIETGILHGTLPVIIDDEPFEVTTYRIDGRYLDRRRPKDVEFVRSLRDDLARRDFTVNAMAYNEKDGLVDLFGGAEDLKLKQLRCVGDPDMRFSEDALRIIRALRFASVLGFEVAPPTAESIHKNKALLKDIAAERIRAEFDRLLCGQGVKSVLLKYADVIEVFIPEIVPLIGFAQHNPYHSLDVWEHTVAGIAYSPNDPVIRLAMLLHDIAKPACFTRDKNGVGHFYGHPGRGAELAETILKRLRYDSRTVNTVKTLVLYHDIGLTASQRNVKKLMNKLGADTLKLLLNVKMSDYRAQSPEYLQERANLLSEVRLMINKVLEEEQCFSLKGLKVSGSDLIRAGIPECTQIGGILHFLLDGVIEGRLQNEKDALMKAAAAYFMETQ